MTQLSKERLETIAAWREKYGENHNVMLPAAEAQEMARRLLAAEAQEPIAWTDAQELRDLEQHGCGYLFTVNPITPNADPRRVIKLYAEPETVALPDDIPPHVLNAISDMCDGGFDAQGIWDLCRAAMLNASQEPTK